jgi:hypothetical protein
MTGDGTPARSRLAAVGTLVCLGLLAAGETGTREVAVATLLATAGTQRLRGVGGLLTGIVVGALSGAVVGYVAVAVFGVPLAMSGAIGLGVALGGGLGVVTNYVATGEGETTDETMTVEREPDHPEPTPADLFDDHPDPVLYVADEGHGPVVRAANEAYGETFDVPVDAVIGAPLEDAVLAGEDTEAVVAAVTADDPLDTVVPCETGDAEKSFRLRTAGSDDDGYLLYTPRE